MIGHQVGWFKRVWFWFILWVTVGWGLSHVFYVFCCQCLETLVSRQMDMQLFLADGCKEALLEEKRRFCFLVDKHCMYSYQTASFHDKVQSIIMPSLIYSFCGCGGVKFTSKTSDLFNAAATAFYFAASGGTILCVTMVMEKLWTDFPHFLLSSLTPEQARDILMAKLSSWQDQCTDATEMPDSVLTMIEGLRTTVPITPLPSPSPSRHSVVWGWPLHSLV